MTLVSTQCVWSTIQMSTAVEWVLQVMFPHPFGSISALLSMLTEFSLPNLVPLGCVARYNHHTHLLFTTIGPLVLMAACAASAVLLSRHGRTLWSQKCFSMALLISFMTLPTTSTTLFRTFHCDKLDDGKRFLLVVSRMFKTSPELSPHHLSRIIQSIAILQSMKDSSTLPQHFSSSSPSVHPLSPVSCSGGHATVSIRATQHQRPTLSTSGQRIRL